MPKKKEAPRYCARCGGPLSHNPNHLRLRHNRSSLSTQYLSSSSTPYGARHRYHYSKSSTEVFYLCGRCTDRVERLLRTEFEMYRGRETPDLPTRQDLGEEARQVTLTGERTPRPLKLVYSRGGQ